MMVKWLRASYPWVSRGEMGREGKKDGLPCSLHTRFGRNCLACSMWQFLGTCFASTCKEKKSLEGIYVNCRV